MPSRGNAVEHVDGVLTPGLGIHVAVGNGGQAVEHGGLGSQLGIDRDIVQGEARGGIAQGQEGLLLLGNQILGNF